MSQDASGIDLETSLGYLLKEASSALRSAMPTELTPARRKLAVASAAVKGVEDRMKSTLDAAEQRQLRALLARCVASLGPTG
jgi:hypothetical protein